MFHLLRRNGQDGDQAVDPEVHAGAETAPPRPSIGLVLGGGAARGFAHIGVLKTLLAKGYVPDIITGTSIGAVIGGCYAAGKLDAIEAWARGLTRRSLLSYLDVSFSGSGLLNGAKLAEKLAEAIGDLAIDKLPVRYAAIATEIGTGHEIWITRGRLIDALRASYALPGIFPPVRLGERWLVDGALVNPVPVSVARALGARLVIAVNVNTDLFGRGTAVPDLGTEPEPSIEEEVASRARVMRSCMMLNASTMMLESPGRLAVPRMRRLAVFSAPNRPNRPRLATSSSIEGSGSVPRSGTAVPRPNRSVLTLTAITRRAPSARATDTGTGLTSAPSTSQRSPSRTGGKIPGNA